MATHRHQEPGAQTLAEVSTPFTKRSKRALTGRVQDERWERRIEEDWQRHFETLQECIRELLTKHQHLRMELMEAGKPSQKWRRDA
jgi:hypothetical protein